MVGAAGEPVGSSLVLCVWQPFPPVSRNEQALPSRAPSD